MFFKSSFCKICVNFNPKYAILGLRSLMMKKEDIVVCNVCQKPSNLDLNAVFVEAFKNGEKVHICTSCIPHVIHGSGEVVKSNEEINQE